MSVRNIRRSAAAAGELDDVPTGAAGVVLARHRRALAARSLAVDEPAAFVSARGLPWFTLIEHSSSRGSTTT